MVPANFGTELWLQTVQTLYIYHSPRAPPFRLLFPLPTTTGDAKMLTRLVGIATVGLALCGGLVIAHGSHSNEQNPSSDWATWHMQGVSIPFIVPMNLNMQS